MADLGFLGGFNADEHKDEFELIQPGDYNVVIEDTEMKENSSGTGEFLVVKLTIVDPPYEGRIIYDRFNLVHVNPKAVDIAQKQFAGLCRAAGNLAPSDSSELHDAEVVAVIGIQKSGDYNEVKRYKSSDKGQHIAPENLASEDAPIPTKQKGKPKAKPAAKAAAPGGNGELNDDIPF